MIYILLCVFIATPLYFSIETVSVFDWTKIVIVWGGSIAVVAWWGVCRFPLKIPYRNPFIIAVLLWVFSSALATLFSADQKTSLLGCFKRYDGLVSVLSYVVLFFTVIRFCDRKKVEGFCSVAIIVACMASVYGVFQHFRLDPYTWGTDFGCNIRSMGTFGHPAFFGAYLVMVIPLCVYKGRWWLLALPLLIVALYYTRTRAAFVAFIISACYYGFMNRRLLWKHKIKLLSSVILFMIICVFQTGDKNSVVSRLLHGAVKNRVFQYKTGLEIAKDNPVFGIGLDTLQPYYLKYSKGVGEQQNRIHNEFVDAVVSRGLLGLGAYLFLIYAFIKMVWRVPDPLVIALTTSVIAYFVQNQFSFGHIPILVLYWFLLGFVFVIVRKNGTL